VNVEALTVQLVARSHLGEPTCPRTPASNVQATTQENDVINIVITITRSLLTRAIRLLVEVGLASDANRNVMKMQDKECGGGVKEASPGRLALARKKK
jgi:hypothetical protein